MMRKSPLQAGHAVEVPFERVLFFLLDRGNSFDPTKGGLIKESTFYDALKKSTTVAIYGRPHSTPALV